MEIRSIDDSSSLWNQDAKKLEIRQVLIVIVLELVPSILVNGYLLK